MVSYQELTVVLTMIMMKVSKSKVAVLVERVKELTITNLDVAHSPTTSNKRGQVASLLFRHLTLVEARYDLRFQEKTEVKLKYTSFIIVDFDMQVVWENVSFSNPVSLDLYTEEVTGAVVKIADCRCTASVLYFL